MGVDGFADEIRIDAPTFRRTGEGRWVAMHILGFEAVGDSKEHAADLLDRKKVEYLSALDPSELAAALDSLPRGVHRADGSLQPLDEHSVTRGPDGTTGPYEGFRTEQEGPKRWRAWIQEYADLEATGSTELEARQRLAEEVQRWFAERSDGEREAIARRVAARRKPRSG